MTINPDSPAHRCNLSQFRYYIISYKAPTTGMMIEALRWVYIASLCAKSREFTAGWGFNLAVDVVKKSMMPGREIKVWLVKSTQLIPQPLGFLELTLLSASIENESFSGFRNDRIF